MDVRATVLLAEEQVLIDVFQDMNPVIVVAVRVVV
jgi:hypothetical protein